MSKDLIQTELGKVMSFQRGYDLTHTQMLGGNFPVVGSSEIIGYHDKPKKSAPVLLIGRSGTVGRPQYYDQDIWPHNTTLFVTDFHGNDPKYCYYLLKALNLEDYSNSSGVPTLNRNFIHPLKVNVHQVFDQKNVARVLSLLDDMIAVKERINTELEETARLIYDYWFTQFDFPDNLGRPYKSSGGEMLYNNQLKREIPLGWEVKNLLDVIEWIGGAQPPKSTFKYAPEVGYVRFIQNRDYADNQNITYIPERSSNKTCIETDIMMDKYGDAGQTRFGIAGAYNVALSRIKVNLHNGQEYIRKFLESKSTYTYLHNACLASTRASLNEEILGNLFIVIPDEKTLKVYENQAKQYFKLTLQNRKVSAEIAEIRDWLLPMLMTGQASVKR